MINMYDQAALMPIMNTYVPINFGELYRIAATLKQDLEDALNQLQLQVMRFGEFTSPSNVDILNYYANTIGQFDDLLDAASLNPELMKDRAFLSRIQSRINGLDYAKLSALRQGAEQLRARQQNVALLKANNRYLQSWDEYADLSNYDTLRQGILEELSPVPYMNANQLSNMYFDLMKPGTIGTTYKDGVRYIVTGNTKDDLYAVANNHFNDLVNTPQGQMYYRQFLQQNNGDHDAARQAFNNMIAASQIDRTLRPTLTVDPSFLTEMKLKYARRLSGKDEEDKGNLTRLDYIRSSLRQVNENNLKGYLSKLPEEQQIQYSSQILELQGQYNAAAQAYSKDPSDENGIRLIQAENALNSYKGGVMLESNRETALAAYNEIANQSPFEDPSSDDFSSINHLKGINSALNKVSTTISMNDKDPIMTGLGAIPINITSKEGNTANAWQFNNSSGLLSPITVFNSIVGNSEQNVTDPVYRDARRLWKDPSMLQAVKVGAMPWLIPTYIADDFIFGKEFTLNQVLESGQLGSVQFIPEGEVVLTGDNQFALKGKVRVPKDRLEDVLGVNWFESTYMRDNKENMGVKEVTEQIGNDERDFYEFTMYKALPKVDENQEYWNYVQSIYANTPSHGGIGGATQANDSQWDIYNAIMN